ncbi:NAD(P)-binding protein [Mytilinidion resinicola]|uniref:NAD(P)-binding protein n=1 Tax=Mytilinidion resinicola TaxID=574789 RepID=A0A6A6XZX4_9PEZI|nr:NAD(P)-binding protein [Mytilinidion resinicola]KAF2801813.1 NAD(P)-binding protein [Mytilinidion resinicola]
MSNNLQGKVIVVTGAGGGMGLETSKMLCARGAKVSMADIQEETLFRAAAEIEKSGGQVMATAVDVRSEKEVAAWIEMTVEKFGKLDGAANLAGVLPKTFHTGTVEDQQTSDWDFVISVNLTGMMFCMRSELQHMNDKGSVVNASSVAGLIGFTNCAAYGASKFGVVGLTKCAAKEVGPTKGIRVNCIAPGIINTPMYQKVSEHRGEGMPWVQQIKREGKPSEIASLICWLLCDESQYISGTVQQIDGGWVC